MPAALSTSRSLGIQSTEVVCVCPTGITDLVEICSKKDGRFDYPGEIHCVSFFFCAFCKGRCWWFWG